MEQGAQQWRAVWAYRWWLLVFVIAAAAATYFVSKQSSPRYEAQALVQIVPGAQTQGNLLTNDQSQSIANAYLQTAKTTPVYGLAGKLLHVPESTVASDTDVQTQQGVLILQVFGDRGNAADAARFANGYADAFAAYVAKLQADNTQARVGPLEQEITALTTQRDALAAADPQRSILTAQITADIQQATAAKAASVDIAKVLQPATAPGSPKSPKPTRNAALALLAALIIGIAVIVAYTWISDRYRSAEEAAADIGLPILGEIPRAAPTSQVSIEAFRRLRTAVLFGLGEPGGDRANSDGHGATVLVAADERGVGKTHTTVNLARSLVTEGRRVVVIDGDLRRPTVHEQFHLRARPGLAELLTDRTVHLAGMAAQDVRLAGTHVGGGELKAVVGGTPVHDSTERLSSRYMADVVQALEQDFDFVLIDSAPLALVVDAVVLSRYSRGVVVIVDARRSKRRDVRRAVAALRGADAPILGIVFNRGRRGGSVYGYGDAPAPAPDVAEVAR